MVTNRQTQISIYKSRNRYVVITRRVLTLSICLVKRILNDFMLIFLESSFRTWRYKLRKSQGWKQFVY